VRPVNTGVTNTVRVVGSYVILDDWENVVAGPFGMEATFDHTGMFTVSGRLRIENRAVGTHIQVTWPPGFQTTSMAFTNIGVIQLEANEPHRCTPTLFELAGIVGEYPNLAIDPEVFSRICGDSFATIYCVN
jgi:hypothetical protein